MTAPRTLLDVLSIAENKDHCPVAAKAFQDNRFDARKFVFTDDVARMMANLVKDHPNAFLDNMQFALPPYHVTYIEFPVGVFLDTLGSRRSHEKWQEREDGHLWDDSKDETIGYLIVGTMVYLLTRTTNGELSIAPLLYNMHFEGTDSTKLPTNVVEVVWGKKDSGHPIVHETDDEYDHMLDHYNILAQALGSTLTNPNTELSQEHAQFLVMNHTGCDEKAFNLVKSQSGDDGVAMLMEGGTGEIRNILMCLLWLNQPKLVDIQSVPAMRGYYKGKFRPYSAYNLVGIKKELTVRRALGVFREHSKHRRHEVQAYFRNFDKHEGCTHEWPMFPDDKGKWTCPKCGQWRIRVKEHMRGDAAIGFVSKDYLVK